MLPSAVSLARGAGRHRDADELACTLRAGPRTIKAIGIPTPAVCQMSMIANNGDPIGVMLARVSGTNSKSIASQMKTPKIAPAASAPRVVAVSSRSRADVARRAA